MEPFKIRVWGQARHVVAMGKGYWTEQADDGRLITHLGNLLVGGQRETRWLDEPRPCTVCRQPCQTLPPGARTRPTHDMCTGWLDAMPDEHLTKIVFGVAAMLGASVVAA